MTHVCAYSKIPVEPMLWSTVNNLITTTLIATIAVLGMPLYTVVVGTDLKKSGDNTNWASAASFKKRQARIKIYGGNDDKNALDYMVKYVLEIADSPYVVANSRKLA